MDPGQSIDVTVRVVGQPDHAFTGLRRRAYITAHADTFFSQPARVSIGGRKLRGFITGSDDRNGHDFCPFTSQL